MVRNKIITLDEFKNDVWNEFMGVEFDSENWINHFVFDLISNNQNKDEIVFSEPIEAAYKGIRNYLYNRVIKSDAIRERDDICKEKIDIIYDYYIENVEILLKKNKKANDYKHKCFGPERVVVDYIQWLGDANADLEYDKIMKMKKKIKVTK